MLELVLFNQCHSTEKVFFDDLLFRQKWDCTITTNLSIMETLNIPKGFKIQTPLDNKQYKTHDSLGRPIPKRDANGKFIKNSIPWNETRTKQNMEELRNE